MDCFQGPQMLALQSPQLLLRRVCGGAYRQLLTAVLRAEVPLPLLKPSLLTDAALTGRLAWVQCIKHG